MPYKDPEVRKAKAAERWLRWLEKNPDKANAAKRKAVDKYQLRKKLLSENLEFLLIERDEENDIFNLAKINSNYKLHCALTELSKGYYANQRRKAWKQLRKDLELLIARIKIAA